jgi:hypothetical protein
MTVSRILLLPGWQNSGPGHWQTLWESVHGDRRVEQHEWMRPLRGDWSARLEEEVLAAPGPVALPRTASAASSWPPGPRIRATRTRCAARCWWRRATWNATICAS